VARIDYVQVESSFLPSSSDVSAEAQNTIRYGGSKKALRNIIASLSNKKKLRREGFLPDALRKDVRRFAKALHKQV
jgi:hypothetical protein